MKKFATIKLFKSFRKVSFYTIQIDEEDKTETDKFFDKYLENKAVTDDLNILVNWIREIGENRGAKSHFFRSENQADALPPPHNILKKLDFGTNCTIRLYCIRLNEKIVILCNGGIKTAQSVQDCPELLPHFRFANNLARQLLKMLSKKEIEFSDKAITNLEEILLTC